MAKRDRTPLFLQLRASARAAPPSFLHARPLASPDGDDGAELVALKRGSSGDPPDPEWVSRYYALVAALASVRGDLASLADAQARHLLPAFGEDDTSAAEEAIASSTRSVTAALHRAERELRALAPDGRGAAERRVVDNIKRALAAGLQSLSLSFRADQKEYMRKLQGMKEAVGQPGRGRGGRATRGQRPLGGGGGRGSSGGVGGGRSSAYDPASGVVEGEDAVLLELELETDMYDTGFDDAQSSEAADARRRAEARSAEVTGIATSITELAVMVKDLAALVIDQGTVLDRVDYNVEEVRSETDRAVGQLRRAERSQRQRASFWCIMCLAIGCGIMASALLLKWLF